ncbi:hypothetical protein J2793_004079 [Paraburkholderia caledonica]|uniref:Uncharacterized protein n=1 Tax=Paraburkholderia caledonica TaxID=134536 RepID=A0AB73IF57_9BURK|nr:hypothetical protein [Paraburkholderia caledonica]
MVLAPTVTAVPSTANLGHTRDIFYLQTLLYTLNVRSTTPESGDAAVPRY